MDKRLNGIIDMTWEHFNKFREQTINIEKNENKEVKKLVPEQSIPILWFGDLEGYMKSERKVVTIAINPSNIEFKRSNKSKSFSFFRFKGGEEIYNKDKLNDNDKKFYYEILNRYFKDEPYKLWFNYYERILKYIQCSYYIGEGKNVAIHIDIQTPLSTEPTWGNIKDNDIKAKISSEGMEIWESLMEYLKPDIALVSINQQTLNSAFNISMDKCTKEFKGIGNNYIREYKKDKLTIISGLNMKGMPFGGMKEEFIKECLESIIK